MKQTLFVGAVCLAVSAWIGGTPAFAESPPVTTGHVRLSFAPYSKISARRVETMRLTRQGKFDAVEAIVVPLQEAYERGELNEFAVATSFAPFSTTDDTLQPQIDRWVQNSPKSWAARLARARWQRNAYQRYAEVDGPVAEEMLKGGIADYRSVLSMKPRVMVAYSDLVEMAVWARDGALLRETVQKAFEADRTSWVVRDSMMRWGLVRGDGQAAFLADAARYEKQNPMLLMIAAAPRMRRANRIWEDGQRAEALAIYDELVKTLDTFELRKHRARLLRTLGRLAESRVEIDHAIALMPGKYDGYRERAWLYAETKQWQEMLADVRRGLEIDPLDPELNRGLGWALEELGDVPGAIEAYALSAKWAPQASLYRKIGKLELDRANDPAAARVSLERAVSLDPEHKWAWYDLADALQKLGDARAIAAWERFLALADPRAPDEARNIAWARRQVAALKRQAAGPPPANGLE